MGKYRQIMLLLAGALFFFLLGGIVLSKSFQESKLKINECNPEGKQERREAGNQPLKAFDSDAAQVLTI